LNRRKNAEESRFAKCILETLSGRGDLNSRPWRLRRHALAGFLYIFQIAPDSSRLYLSFLFCGISTSLKFFRMYHFPRYATLRGFVLSSIMFSQPILQIPT
jgi:hypothetical protein